MVAIFQGLDAEVYFVVPPPFYEDGAYDMNATVINTGVSFVNTAHRERDGRDGCDRCLRRAGRLFTERAGVIL